MKRVELKTVPVEGQVDQDGRPVVLDYRHQIGVIIRNPESGQQGMGVDEMRKSIRILDALDAADDVMELEDAEYDYMKSKVLNTKFNFASRELLQFVDDVTNVE